MTTGEGPEVCELFFDTTGRSEGAYDAVLDQSPEYKNLRLGQLQPSTSGLPNEIWFWGTLDRIRQLDLLMVETGWEVISKRMLKTLETIRQPLMEQGDAFLEAQRDVEQALRQGLREGFERAALLLSSILRRGFQRAAAA